VVKDASLKIVDFVKTWFSFFVITTVLSLESKSSIYAQSDIWRMSGVLWGRGDPFGRFSSVMLLTQPMYGLPPPMNPRPPLEL
jgi:hypothetical protein